MEKTTDKKLLRIAVVGPESTAKSTLSTELANHYHTVFVPEYAREYLDKLNRPYTIDDILAISKRQIELEEELQPKANRFLICDTNLIVSKVWAEFKYHQCPQWIVDTINTRHYDLYLLCNIDIPWQPDPQREHPEARKELFSIYKHEVEKTGVPYVIISGLGEERLKAAVKAMDAL